MTGEIEVLKPGLFSTIQDGGRFGFLEFGVPISGPMDFYASRFGNLILNNSQDAAVLEITQSGPALKFMGSANIAITGGNLSPQINGYEIKNGRVYSLINGDILSFGNRVLGCRSYIAVQGGFEGEKVLDSYSWYDGITPHFRLEKGMKLHFKSEKQRVFKPTSGIKFNNYYLSDLNVPVFTGPEFHLLPYELQEELCRKTFSVNVASNRMGIQLNELLENKLQPIITGPVIPGTVQLTPSGKIIILMRDCQTTGGYPRVLQLSREGMDILAQKFTGDEVRFALAACPQ